MSCHSDPCKTRSCPGHLDTVCQYNICMLLVLLYRYHDQFIEVTNECGKYNNNIIYK